MKTPRGIHSKKSQLGSTLLVTMSTILVLSIAGAGVLMNCTTRFNSTSNQVKGWKEALVAAEAGADLAFAEIRQNGLDQTGTAGFATASGWSSPEPSPTTATATNSWSLGGGASPFPFGSAGNLSTKVTVEKFTFPESTWVGYYRIRSIGIAQVAGLKRTGMDNRVDGVTKGDNLLRKIDFGFDHFIANYGFGDALASAAASGSNGKAQVAVTDPNKPQVSRRIELVVIPVMPIEGAIKTSGSFSGTTVDSYDSSNPPVSGSNPPSSYYGSTPTGANAAYAADSQNGDVVCGSSTFSAGHIYGDVTTNGGSASTSNISGVVDNNVPIVVPTATPGVSPIPLMPGMALFTYNDPYDANTTVNGTAPSTITPSATPRADGTLQRTFWYTYSSVSNITINPLKTAGGTPIDTTVNLYVTGDVDGITVNKGVTANIYFRGNMGGKARDYDNNNADGALTQWTWFYANAAARTGATGFVAADIGKVAFQDGSPPGTYWKLTATTPAWASYSPPIPAAADVVCVPPAKPKWTYATAAARTSAAGFVAADVGKTAYQADTQVFYTLTATTPTWTAMAAYTASPLVSRAGHVWYYGISPADGSARTITIQSPGTMWAAFYAPSHDFAANGNPDFYGVMVVKSFYQNGNCTFHFDKQLASSATPTDYRVASYIEDVR
jgi:hypothetical protein